MESLLAFLAIFLGVVLVGILGWRVLSRRSLLPCPAAFIWMLEHRIMENVAGATALIERAGIQPGMVVLDAGCGPGRVSIPLAHHVGPHGSVVALDLQEAMIERLRTRVDSEGISNIKTLQSKLGEADLARNKFDRALMVTVLGEVPNRKAALMNIHHALKPGGILSITEVLPDPHFQRRKVVRKLGIEVGFDVEFAYNGLRAYTMNLQKPVGTK